MAYHSEHLKHSSLFPPCSSLHEYESRERLMFKHFNHMMYRGRDQLLRGHFRMFDVVCKLLLCRGRSQSRLVLSLSPNFIVVEHDT
jgi:hypothetical protein